MNNEEAFNLIRPIAQSVYSVSYPWRSLERTLDDYRQDYGLNLAPDYQRGRVWTLAQQQHYIENVFRGVIPPETMIIQWSCPHWNEDDYAGELPREMQILDGLQRLTAVLDYLAGKVRPFGHSIDDFAGTRFDVRMRTQYRFTFAVYDFATRAELLQHYIDLNSGGTPHSADEIERVRGLIPAAA